MSTVHSLSLTKGKIAFVSAEDYAALHHIGRWYSSNSGYMMHYFTGGRRQTQTLYAYRFIMERLLGQAIPFGLQVDHVDQNRLNNQRSNLRLRLIAYYWPSMMIKTALVMKLPGGGSTFSATRLLDYVLLGMMSMRWRKLAKI